MIIAVIETNDCMDQRQTATERTVLAYSGPGFVRAGTETDLAG